MSDHPPSILLTRLYRKQSKSGATYFVGRLAAARVVLLKSKETGDSGEEIWSLLLSEGPPKPEQRQAKRDWQAPRGPGPSQQAGYRLHRDSERGAMLDDPLPF